MFNLWDRVRDNEYGEGVIINITKDDVYPVEVAFQHVSDAGHHTQEFTLDGRWQVEGEVTLHKVFEEVNENRIYMVLDNGVSVTTSPLYLNVRIDKNRYATDISDWDTTKLLQFIRMLDRMSAEQVENAFLLSDLEEEHIETCIDMVRKGKVYDVGVESAEALKDQVGTALHLPSFVEDALDWSELYGSMLENEVIVNPNTGEIEKGHYVEYNGGVLAVLE